MFLSEWFRCCRETEIRIDCWTELKFFAASAERLISPDKWVPSWRGLLSRLSGRKEDEVRSQMTICTAAPGQQGSSSSIKCSANFSLHSLHQQNHSPTSGITVKMCPSWPFHSGSSCVHRKLAIFILEVVIAICLMFCHLPFSHTGLASLFLRPWTGFSCATLVQSSIEVFRP